MNVSTAVANSSAPELATSLAGHVRAAAVGAMPSAAAVCVSVAAAMPVAMNTALWQTTKQQKMGSQWTVVHMGGMEDAPVRVGGYTGMSDCKFETSGMVLQH